MKTKPKPDCYKMKVGDWVSEKRKIYGYFHAYLVVRTEGNKIDIYPYNSDQHTTINNKSTQNYRKISIAERNIIEKNLTTTESEYRKLTPSEKDKLSQNTLYNPGTFAQK
jgi:hypothetical protein